MIFLLDQVKRITRELGEMPSQWSVSKKNLSLIPQTHSLKKPVVVAYICNLRAGKAEIVYVLARQSSLLVKFKSNQKSKLWRTVPENNIPSGPLDFTITQVCMYPHT